MSGDAAADRDARRAAALVEAAGGRAGMRAILARFYERMARDPMVGFFFAGRDLAAIVEGQLGFLLKALGVTSEFEGRHPGVAHRDLAPILRGHFDRRLRLLEETLDECGVDPELREAWLAIERSMRTVVVRR